MLCAHYSMDLNDNEIFFFTNIDLLLKREAETGS